VHRLALTATLTGPLQITDCPPPPPPHLSVLTLAGVALPTGRVIDGIDLSPRLLEREGASGHVCLFQYYTGLLLAAVRCGKYKLRFDTQPLVINAPYEECTAHGGHCMHALTAAVCMLQQHLDIDSIYGAC
jgi:hypothetical protein